MSARRKPHLSRASAIKPGAIDLGSKPSDRKKAALALIDAILAETDGGAGNDKVRWIRYHLMSVLWHESAALTTRVQGNGGPGRGLMQFEPDTLSDRASKYILDEKKGAKARAHLALALADTEAVVKAMLTDFVATQSGKEWPAKGEAAAVEAWLADAKKANDSYGIVLMRYYYKSFAKHAFPGEGHMDKDPKDYPDEHVDNWCDWWNRDCDKDKRKLFLAHLAEMDAVKPPI